MLFSSKLNRLGIIMCKKVETEMKSLQLPVNSRSQHHQNRDFECAIKALDQLQSNRKNIENTILQKGVPHNEFSNTLIQVEKYLKRVDIPLTTLDTLSVIHVAGTKGKGSTCAFCESILRFHGFKTGFFSSPHILDVCERIRLNGVPISHEEFARYFWLIYEKLDQLKDNDEDMPHYFRILAIMAFKVFLEEKVDVAIIEVGIGGQYDCTNILRKVPVAGITSLGLDHTDLLGDTIEKIAWQKAGIMKEGSIVFTVPQPTAAMNVLKRRAIERKCVLQPIITEFCLNVTKPIQAPLKVFYNNASLARAMAQRWIVLKGGAIKYDRDLTAEGLDNCCWPGRYQIIPFNGFNFYVDGAHTPESIQLCADWFSEKTATSTNEKVLVFNTTGNRNSEVLLSILAKVPFHTVFFTPNVAVYDKEAVMENDRIRCQLHYKTWMKLSAATSNVLVCSAVNDIFSHLSTIKSYDVLVTGSLYLVSATLSIINPNLKAITAS